MRVFVYEYLSSGAAGEDAASAALHAEGWAMLSAVLEDFSRCPGVETVTLLDPRLLPPVTGEGGLRPAAAASGSRDGQVVQDLAERAVQLANVAEGTARMAAR